jgi:hypothetical protein
MPKGHQNDKGYYNTKTCLIYLEHNILHLGLIFYHPSRRMSSFIISWKSCDSFGQQNATAVAEKGKTT